MHCTDALLSLLLKCYTFVYVRAQAPGMLEAQDVHKDEAPQVRSEHGHCCRVQALHISTIRNDEYGVLCAS